MNKSIFITGASSGIGYALSQKFSDKGWSVIASARRLNLLKKLKNESNNKDLIKPIKLDITDRNLVNIKFTGIVKKYGVPDILFLNAGTNNPNSSRVMSITETKEIFDINFFGTLNCISEALPYLKKKKGTQIIIMSSVAGYRGLPYASAYCSSKAALTSFAESIYHQCSQLGIKIRIVNPGFIKTPLTDKNRFPMPFIISSDKSADILYKKFVYSKSFEINCPWFFCFIMKILRILPYKLYFKLTNLITKK